MDAEEEEDTLVSDLRAEAARAGILEQMDSRMAELRRKHGEARVTVHFDRSKPLR